MAWRDNLNMRSLPYLQQASQGGLPQRSYTLPSFQYPQIYNPNYSQFDPMQEAKIAQERIANNANINSGVTMTGLREAFGDNGNPEYQRGLVDVNYYGQKMRIPNALLQQIQFQDKWNQGRGNAFGAFFGTQGQPEGSPYRNIDVQKKQIDQYVNNMNPEYLGEGSLDPYKRSLNQYSQAQAQLQQLNRERQTQPMVEYRNMQGARMGNGSADVNQDAINKAQKEADLAARGLSYTGGRGAADRGRMFANQAFSEMAAAIPGIKPTYANKPITEQAY